MKTFRSVHPQRNYAGERKTNYSEYRADLARDFNGRCGYTDCSHFWWGGSFHIDHFAPKNPRLDDQVQLAKFKELECEYGNLVYSCPQVNRAKSNDWASDDPNTPILGQKGYLDPCTDLNEFFERTDTGGIVPKDHIIAKYMWKRLRLYLLRYELYWRMEQLMERMQKLQISMKLTGLPEEERNEIKNAIVELNNEYLSYWSFLNINYAQIR